MEWAESARHRPAPNPCRAASTGCQIQHAWLPPGPDGAMPRLRAQDLLSVAERPCRPGSPETALNCNGVAFDLNPRAASEIPSKTKLQLPSVNDAEYHKNPARRLIVKRGTCWELSSHGPPSSPDAARVNSHGWRTRKKRCGALVAGASTCISEPSPVKLVW